MLCNPLNTVQINSVRRDVLLYYTQQLWIKNDCSTPLLHINPTPFLKKSVRPLSISISCWNRWKPFQHFQSCTMLKQSRAIPIARLAD